MKTACRKLTAGKEERRLMYVALTRARRRLHLSFAQKPCMLHGRTRHNVASEAFIGDSASVGAADQPRQSLKFRVSSQNIKSGVSRPMSNSPIRNFTAPNQESPWRIGQNVVHPKFGAGVIVNAEGRGGKTRACGMNFQREGTKWLALSVC